eukprot:TRINITY_DN59_c0_g1_i4.p1 TRINITY_DN59_c0_g1~~TRINITY_DN59_c0_g1_i4.p1  ORF type:complete len:269 (-),score=78.57 TRINITY_DN59_c0_g1_i4:77-883(-)
MVQLSHADLNEHQANTQIAQQSAKCPFFSQAMGGCPYDPAHPQSWDAGKIKQCPSFANGCPYKDVKGDQWKKCPAFVEGKCPFDQNHHIDMSLVKQCPAFEKGCPYMNIHVKPHSHANMDNHTATKEIAVQSSVCPFFQQAHGGCPYDPAHPHSWDGGKIKQCPSFANGCPYKDVKGDQWKKCPAFVEGKCPFDQNHHIDMSLVKQCPAFVNGCPYMHIHNGVEVKSDSNTSSTTTTTTNPPSSQPQGDAAQCPFAHMHGKVENPHDK